MAVAEGGVETQVRRSHEVRGEGKAHQLCGSAWLTFFLCFVCSFRRR